jgi:hypothetical protein
MSKLQKIPEFASEAEERAFWESHDSSDYMDWRQAQPTARPNLKLSTKTISLRLPEGCSIASRSRPTSVTCLINPDQGCGGRQSRAIEPRLARSATRTQRLNGSTIDAGQQ